MSLQTLPPQQQVASRTRIEIEPLRGRTLFVSAPLRRSRIPGLSASLLLHGLLLGLLLLVPGVAKSPSPAEPEHHRYSVRFVHLQMPPEYRKRETASAGPAAPPSQNSHAGPLMAASQLPRPAVSSPKIPERAAAAAPRTLAPEHRQFKLPPTVPVQAVKQTLVQMDVPPTVTLKQEVPLPTMLLWTETPPAPRRRFVAPPVRRETPKVVESLPVAPAIENPNRELTPAEISVASVVTTVAPHLVHPPAVASPVSRTGERPAKEIPQVGLAETTQPSAVNLISLPANPLHSSSMLVLPPANQVAAADVGTAGSRLGHEGGSGTTERSTGLEGRSSPAGTGGIASVGSSGGNGPAGSTGSKTATGSGTGSGPGAIAGGASAGNGANGSSPGASAGGWSATGVPGMLEATATPPGVTRIDLPKEGHFGVVVLGSSGSASYPESAGALSGKVVYTVYLKVGLKKSWVLQYCLTKGGASAASGTGPGTTPVQAPWPFLIMRPDQISSASADYTILHGNLTEAGKFDKLALVFPDDLEKKELLMSSLKLWAFRPAMRDGVAVPVEVLLIIPREPD